MSYSYIQKKDLFIQRNYSWKKELFIYKKKFLVIMIYKKVSCTKMLYNCYKKMSYSYKKVIHTKKEVIHTKKIVIHTTKMNYSYIIYTKNELFIYILKKTDLFIQRSYSYKKRSYSYTKKI